MMVTRKKEDQSLPNLYPGIHKKSEKCFPKVCVYIIGFVQQFYEQCSKKPLM